MLLDDAASALIKDFIIANLDGHDAEADSDILADYCLALLKSTDLPDAALKASVAENLQDFLPDRYLAFTDDLFAAIESGSYDPSRPKILTANGKQPAFPHPSRPQDGRNGSKKRAYGDLDLESNRNGHGQLGDRPVKQVRRGGRGGSEPRGGRSARVSSQYGHQPQMPAAPIPNFFSAPVTAFSDLMLNPADPMAAMAKLQAMQQQMMSMMASMTGVIPSNSYHPTQRCRDYDNKGFCTRGVSCPYEHGEDRLIVPSANDEYDPSCTSLSIHPVPTNSVDIDSLGSDSVAQARERGRGAHHRGSGKRSELSHSGANKGRHVTAIVVEAIPEDKFEEQTVREFFGQFGHIDRVDMQPYKRLAVVTYDAHESAKGAYESSKVVFDNRFVKVYWAKSDSRSQQSWHGRSGSSALNGQADDLETEDVDPPVDVQELAKKQEDAQRKHDEHKRLRQAANQQKAELAAKLRKMEVEGAKMQAVLAKRLAKTSGPPNDSTAVSTTRDNEQTRLLKEQLARLEAEAESLGIEPGATSDYSYTSHPSFPPSHFRGRGRGSYRGRPRGRGGFPSYRGGAMGYTAKPFTGVKKIDNRPKVVSVVFQEGEYEAHEEVLRQHLLFGHETANLSKHPDRHDAALVKFEQRFEAENFIAGARTSEALNGGKAELTWYRTDEIKPGTVNGGVEARDVTMESSEGIAAQPQSAAHEVRDLDTYNEDDVY